MVARPQFDLTPETAVPGADAAGGVRLGEVLDWNRVGCGDLAVPLASLNRHVFVCGATGAGKSQTVRNLLEQAAGAGIPWLVVEPAKAEYRLMAARLPRGEVIRIRPGDLGEPAAGINPLEPAPGPGGTRFPLQTHADLLRALFLAAFQADEPFPQVLSAALTRCYEQAGWDLVTGQPAIPGVQPAYPSLEDLQAAAMHVVERDRLRPGGPPTTCAGSSPSGSGPCGWAPPAGSSTAATRSTSAALLDAQRGAGDRGRRRRPRQGVPDGRGADPADRAPAAAAARASGPAARRAAAPDRDRGGAPAAAPAPARRRRAARPRTRSRCSPTCSPRSAPTARAWSSSSRSPPS